MNRKREPLALMLALAALVLSTACARTGDELEETSRGGATAEGGTGGHTVER